MHRPTEDELYDIFRSIDIDDIVIDLERCVSDRQALNKVFDYLTFCRNGYKKKAISLEDYQNVIGKVIQGIIEYRRHP